MKQSNLTNLVADAWRYGSSSASNGKWRASINTCAVKVWHHGTHMFDCRMGLSGMPASAGVTPVGPGYGSTSDRCGVRRITEGAYVEGIGYKELYGE